MTSCDFCNKQIRISGGGMATHLQRSTECHAKFQALMNLVTQSASSRNLPMDTGDQSTELELDIHHPTPTDTDQVHVGAPSDANDPPPDDDDPDLQSDFSDKSQQNQLSASDAN